MIDERVHEGQTYYVDPLTGDIYEVETGDVIGHWEGDAETGIPHLTPTQETVTPTPLYPIHGNYLMW